MHTNREHQSNQENKAISIYNTQLSDTVEIRKNVNGYVNTAICTLLHTLISLIVHVYYTVNHKNVTFYF